MLIPVCFIGDFNIISGSHEKQGGAPFRFDWKVRDFINLISANALVDLAGSLY